MPDPALTRWRIDVPAERREEALLALLDALPDGFEETAEGFAAYLPAAAPGPILPAWLVAEPEAVADGWRDAWRAFHRPVEVAGTWVRPPWLAEPVDAVLLEPGYAFGTGAHPTTRGVAAFLRDEPPGALVDLGCGSGLLSILAATWGHAPIEAWDLDPHAVDAARANLERNGLGNRVAVRHADVLVETLPSVDLVLANIERRVNEALLQRAGLPDRVIVSGVRREDDFAFPGWSLERETVEDGWRTLVLIR
ncbi:MAG: 50S ribosomal protein L11 methyltransferase [Gaiellales bacterium]